MRTPLPMHAHRKAFTANESANGAASISAGRPAPPTYFAHSHTGPPKDAINMTTDMATAGAAAEVLTTIAHMAAQVVATAITNSRLLGIRLAAGRIGRASRQGPIEFETSPTRSAPASLAIYDRHLPARR